MAQRCQVCTYTFKPPAGKEIKSYENEVNRYLYRKHDEDVSGINIKADADGKHVLTFIYRGRHSALSSFTLDICELDADARGIPDVTSVHQIAFQLVQE